MAIVLLFDPHKFWHVAAAAVALTLAIIACGHAVLYKRETRSAIAWVGFICLVPMVGSLMYFVFGVNRLRRRAILLRGQMERYRADSVPGECLPEKLPELLPPHASHMNLLARVVGAVVARPILPGNLIEPLINGDNAFPAMLAAIAAARKTVSLQTYIFDRDDVGIEFARALGDAARRGVEVRVLIDAAGTRYSWPSILGELRSQQVKHARFLPTMAPWSVTTLNMRTHRKLLVIDGMDGFTGGMNIRAGNCLLKHPASPVQDIHFHVRGPVVTQLQEAFTDDWMFTTKEALRGEAWFPKPQEHGNMLVRGITDGPDEDFEKLRWTLLGALSIARRSVKIVTPYFLPDAAIVSSLILAAMRGVKVEILLPSINNLPVVHWASRSMWWQILEHGCHIWLTAPPFDHSKLMVVDGCWTLVGSANWDARSLRLNFEYNLECYDPVFAAQLEGLIEEKRKSGREVTMEEVDARSLPIRLRDGLARLLSPYL
ncbi:MAG TPA: phospholipase D-like domain-containing protein [Verrucomicrobiae bacterium]|jgi:cardiolipin synthase|nr:phospholipase D-like domain-containing protein [Verrucomicrobiae bacterium]